MGLYCPVIDESHYVAERVFNAKLYGANKLATLFQWNVDNANTMLKSGYSVFGSLGGDTGIDVSTDYADFGVPFFLGRTVFVGFAGITITDLQAQQVTYPNGFWAF